MALTDPAFDDALGHRAIGFGAAAEARGLNTSPLAKASPSAGKVTQPKNILDPGFDLTLRPMRYPQFYDMYLEDYDGTLIDVPIKVMQATDRFSKKTN